MEYKNLGRSGLKVSVVGLGCMNFGMMNDEKESVDMVHKALDLGINLFDTADVYGERGRSEQFLGKGLGDRREGAIIATKFAGPMSSERFDMQGGSRRYIRIFMAVFWVAARNRLYRPLSDAPLRRRNTDRRKLTSPG